MNNNLLFPFERNRYYAGKMLTSADFGAEQNYMNNKRRFLNNLMFGSGIVCGCNVYSLDDLSVFIESGCAVDSLGREIIIDTSVVKKLSAIEGFEQIDSNHLTLCLRYKEELVHPVYSVKHQNADTEYEYNRIKEGYELFLVDTQQIEKQYTLETEFLAKDFLYRDENYEIAVQMPATVCKGRYVKLQLTVRKLSDSEENFNFKGILQTPSFLSMEGKHEQEISFENLNLLEGETVSKDYWFFVQAVSSNESILILKNDGNDTNLVVEKSFSMKILLSDITPRELVDRELAKVSLEMHGMGETRDFITLADISLIRTDSAYIIEHIEERNVKKYIEVPACGAERSEYLEYFHNQDFIPDKSEETPVSVGVNIPQYRDSNQIQIATGTLEIPVGGKAKAGSVYYSGEIMHGLGAGTVYVEIGKEFIEDDPVLGANVKSTVYGNSELFKEMEGKAPETETAVKVLNDKGGFIAAAKFKSDTDCLMLTYRWIAIKFAGNGIQEQSVPSSDQWIEAETPTVVMGTRENHYFGVKYHNMEKCSIGYEVTEPDGGKITQDGVYTSPNKEGVHEIRIYSMEQPYVCTYAYAVVKKK